MSDNQGFTHLHLHSQYSLLDGAIRVDDLLPAIKEKGMDSVAVTDHGNMYGAVHFYKTAQKHGIKPIMGCETYVATSPQGRTDRNSRESAHLVLVAKDNEGYKNLAYLVSMGFMEGYYYNPRIDKELLKKHSKGLYGLSACLGGVVNKPLLREGEAAAAAAAKEFKDLFEPGHFFLELQDNGYKEQEHANTALMNISEVYDIPLVATADSHYLKPQDSAAHEILMCIGQSKSLQEFRGKMHHSDLLYVRTPQEMWAAFEHTAPQAVENTRRIAESCNVTLNLSDTYLPNYGVPEGHTRESYLEQVAYQGLKKRLEEAPYATDTQAYKTRLDYELGVITRMGFAGYFLIVWDFIRYAKESNIPVGPGRGSGAGSLVAWALRITNLDPIPYDLLFERFLNPERVSMPDFDIDFCQDRRGEVIQYVSSRYGKNNVGQIVTYSQLSAKSVIKDVGRVLEIPFAEINELTKLIPGLVDGKKVSIDHALELEPKLRDIQKEKPIYKEVISIARSLEGLNRQTGMHAAGIVIGDKPLWEYVPVCRGKEGELVTQFAKDEVEQAGLVKFDFLGLKTLTVIANAIKHIHARSGEGAFGPYASFDIDAVPLNDAKVFQLIASGDTDGVFQLESSGFKELLKRLKPDCFEDIVAAGALYRPGPLDAGMVDEYIARKHGRKKVAYPHAVCETILKPTYGVLVYQEQVMRIAVTLCGFSMGEADVLRKAMGKKKADVMAELREKFVMGAHTQHGMPQNDAHELFTQIEKFAGYAFNKSHSAAYAVVTYQTAFLKTYFPVEFMAALLSTEMRDQDNVVRYIQSAREHRISVLPPCVNTSERDFTVVPQDNGTQAIVFGLGAVKGIGDAAIDTITQARSHKPFTSLYGFCESVDSKRVNRKVLEALIKSGACDVFKRHRAQLLASVDTAIDIGQRAQKDRESGQRSLFELLAPTQNNTNHTEASYAQVPSWDKKTLLAFEKEALGFYITGHPLDDYSQDLSRLCNAHTGNIASFAHKQGPKAHEVTLAGIVSSVRERPLKNGSGRMAFFVLEDLHGSCEAIVFSKAYADCEHWIKSDQPVLVQGTVVIEGDEEEGGGMPKLRVSSMAGLSDARAAKTRFLEIRTSTDFCSDEKLQELKTLLEKHPGPVPVHLVMTSPHTFTVSVELPHSLKITPTDVLVSHLERFLGEKAVRLG